MTLNLYKVHPPERESMETDLAVSNCSQTSKLFGCSEVPSGYMLSPLAQLDKLKCRL